MRRWVGMEKITEWGKSLAFRQIVGYIGEIRKKSSRYYDYESLDEHKFQRQNFSFRSKTTVSALLTASVYLIVHWDSRQYYRNNYMAQWPSPGKIFSRHMCNFHIRKLVMVSKYSRDSRTSEFDSDSQPIRCFIPSFLQIRTRLWTENANELSSDRIYARKFRSIPYSQM